MSGLLLIQNLDGQPATARGLEPIFGYLDHRGPDGHRLEVAGGTLLGHWHFWTTPEEVGERQPLVDPEAGLILAFDGRLDNREELCRSLELEAAEGLSDARLILAAYRRWGRHCLERLLGPFALVLVDELRRAVLCGRDSLGARSLFYHQGPRLFVVASEAGAVAAHPQVPDELDEISMVRFLAVEGPQSGETYFSSVKELPAAHGLWLEGGRRTLWSTWSPELSSRIRYRRDQDYEEHFRETLWQSIQCRLRADRRPALLMSGGVDSTSIAALAAQRLEAGHVPTALSWVFNELPSCDERLRIHQVVRSCGLHSMELEADHLWPLSGDGPWPTQDSSPWNHPYRRLLDGSYRTVQQQGSTVLLDGWFGDHLWVGAPPSPLELAREGQWLAAARRIGSKVLRRTSRRASIAALRARWPWLSVPAIERLAPTLPVPSPEPRRRIFEGVQVATAIAETHFAHRAGVEARHPYRDRRLVELVLALPTSQIRRSGRSKHVLRRAMAGLLPATVLAQGDTGRLDDLFLRGLLVEKYSNVNKLLLRPGARFSYLLDVRWIRNMMQELPAASPRFAGIKTVALWQCISAELWHRDRLV